MSHLSRTQPNGFSRCPARSPPSLNFKIASFRCDVTEPRHSIQSMVRLARYSFRRWLRNSKKILIIVGDDKEQDNLLDDLPTFLHGSAVRFPACLVGANPLTTVDLEYGERLRLVKSIAAGDTDPIVVATVPSLLQSVPSRESIEGHSKRISIGDQIDVDEFQAWLKEQGFHPTTAVELPGEFSFRGGILDIFATDWAGPVPHRAIR
jgi:transcription-repair coupling factor (superfamily II helicase)